MDCTQPVRRGPAPRRRRGGGARATFGLLLAALLASAPRQAGANDETLRLEAVLPAVPGKNNTR